MYYGSLAKRNDVAIQTNSVCVIDVAASLVGHIFSVCRMTTCHGNDFPLQLY